MRSASGISAAGFFESAATGSVRSSALSLIRSPKALQFCENLCVPGSLKHVCAQTLRVLPILIRDIPRPFAKPIFLHINYLAPNSCRFSANLLSFYKRLWRSLKQQEVYRHAYETVARTRTWIADYLRYFNEEHPRQGFDNRTPEGVFYKRKPLTKAA